MFMGRNLQTKRVESKVFGVWVTKYLSHFMSIVMAGIIFCQGFDFNGKPVIYFSKQIIKKYVNQSNHFLFSTTSCSPPSPARPSAPHPPDANEMKIDTTRLILKLCK